MRSGKNTNETRRPVGWFCPNGWAMLGLFLQENDDNLSDLGGDGKIFRYVQSKPDGLTPTSSERTVGVPKFSVVTGSGYGWNVVFSLCVFMSSRYFPACLMFHFGPDEKQKSPL